MKNTLGSVSLILYIYQLEPGLFISRLGDRYSLQVTFAHDSWEAQFLYKEDVIGSNEIELIGLGDTPEASIYSLLTYRLPFMKISDAWVSPMDYFREISVLANSQIGHTSSRKRSKGRVALNGHILTKTLSSFLRTRASGQINTINQPKPRLRKKISITPSHTKNHEIGNSMRNPKFLGKERVVTKNTKIDPKTIFSETCRHGEKTEYCPHCSSWGDSYEMRQHD